MVTENIPTINVLQEPDLNKYFIYENNNKNCIDRSKSKRKAIIIDKYDNDDQKTMILSLLEYLDFDIKDFSDSVTVEKLETNLIEYVINVLVNDEIEVVDCFLCFIHGHGDENDNILFDRKFNSTFKLQMILDIFCGNARDTKDFNIDLTETSKLFFVDSCRGILDDMGEIDDEIFLEEFGINVNDASNINENIICQMKDSDSEIKPLLIAGYEKIVQLENEDEIKNIKLQLCDDIKIITRNNIRKLQFANLQRSNKN